MLQGEKIEMLTYISLAYLPITTVTVSTYPDLGHTLNHSIDHIATQSLYSMNVLPSQATLGSFFIVLAVIMIATISLAFNVRKLVLLSSRSYTRILALLSSLKDNLNPREILVRIETFYESNHTVVELIKSVSTYDYGEPSEKWMPLLLVPANLRLLQSFLLRGLWLSTYCLAYGISKLKIQRNTIVYSVKFSWGIFVLDVSALLFFPLWIGIAIATAVSWLGLAVVSVVLWLLGSLNQLVCATTTSWLSSRHTSGQV